MAKRICFGLTSIGLLFSLFVEFIRLDGEIGRMNTVFKFYLQVWTLFSVVAGVALAWLIGQINNWNKISRRQELGGYSEAPERQVFRMEKASGTLFKLTIRLLTGE